MLSNIPDWKKNIGQLLVETYDLRRELSQTEAQLRAAEAHYAVMARALAAANARLASMSKKKTRGTTKSKRDGWHYQGYKAPSKLKRQIGRD